MFKKHLRDVTLQLGKISSAAVSTNMTAASSVSHSEMIEKLRNGIAFANTDVKMRPIYLDVQATTPMDPRVVDAEKAVDLARKQVADLIGADPREIIFTSGATESNNIAIKGVANFYRVAGKNHVITAQTEHKCVLDSCRFLESIGHEVTYIPVKSNGVIDLDVLGEAIRPTTSLVSIMARGLRSGTLPAPLIIGFGVACDIANREREFDYVHVSALAKRLIDGLNAGIPQVLRNGDPDMWYPGLYKFLFIFLYKNVSISYKREFAYGTQRGLIITLLLYSNIKVALSSGSACTSASLEPSYVLRAIGADEDLAHSSIRFGIGRFTTEEEIDFTIEKCVNEAHRLRERMKNPFGLLRQIFGSFKELRVKKPSTPDQSVVVLRKPTPDDLVAKKDRSAERFDRITHTGQAWDEVIYLKAVLKTISNLLIFKADYRLARFEYSPKQVNPNIAAHLVAERAPVPCEKSVVFCDGGHTHGGHPRV
uniref:Cysteine desulfurase, mitochondrial n=1 Tax=Meloidogyne hapla TaxID=6305 RepID=A0A1I8B2L1_MELHA